MRSIINETRYWSMQHYAKKERDIGEIDRLGIFGGTRYVAGVRNVAK